MNSRRHVYKLLATIMTICITLCTSFYFDGTVIYAQKNASIGEDSLCGVWIGKYAGLLGDEVIERKLRLDIDYSANGTIEGIATIDDGANGSYFFDGNIEFETGNIEFEGTDWIENPSDFGFASFSGAYNAENSTIQGTLDDEGSRTFLLSKESNEYVSKRIDIENIPREWKGEYDGHHGDTVVRRDYEIHIQNIDYNGQIKGTAIIAPSTKADASLGANGSYYFEGKIDSRRGKIKMQGNGWIEYPVSSGSYSEWDFAKLEGFFDLSSGSISGNSEDGIWEMKVIDYEAIKKLSGFTLGRDNNNFIHTSDDDMEGAGFAGINDYTIDDTYFNRLTQNSDEGEINRIKKEMESEWGGSCYGIAMTMGLLYEGYIGMSDLTDSNKSNYYSLDYPCEDEKLLNTINYYQLSQMLENGGRESAIVSSTIDKGLLTGLGAWLGVYDSLPVFLKKLVEYSASNHVEIMGFSTDKGGHAVLVTGCIYDQTTDKYRVEIYDENCVLSKGEKGTFGYMYIEKDYSGFEYIEPNGEKLTDKNYSSIYFIDWNSLGNVVLCTSSDEEASYARIDFPMGKQFKMADETGKYLAYDGEKLSGDIPVHEVDTIDLDEGSRLVVVTENVENLHFSELGDTIDINVTVDESYMGVKGTSIEEVSINLKEGIKLRGKNFDYKTFVTTGEISANEKGLISLEGSSKSAMEVTVDGTGVKVKSDEKLSDIKTESYVGANVIGRKYTNVGASFSVDSEAKVDGGTEITNDGGAVEETTKDTPEITVKKSIEKAKVSLSKTSYAYDGKGKKPKVVVKLGNKTLKSGIQYTLGYKNNKNVGNASVIITGKGEYEGTITKTFKIVPKGTVLSKVTAKKKQITISWKKQRKSTTGYQIQYSTSKKFKGAKIKTVSGNKKTSVKISGLKSGKKYYVRIRTYKVVKGKKYYSSWSKAKSVKMK